MTIAAISRKVLKIYLSVEMAHLLLTITTEACEGWTGLLVPTKAQLEVPFLPCVKYLYKLGFFIQVVK